MHNRRKFLYNSLSVAAGTVILPSTLRAAPNKKWTVGEIIDLFLKEINGAPFSQTVDTLKSGSRDSEVTGIVTTMFATIPVIRKAIEAKANFIIAHEPTFYNHLDETEWLKDNEVYQYKAKLLKDNNITIWRNHDYIHSHKPDGVMDGVIERLGWQKYSRESDGYFEVPDRALKDLISECKEKLGVSNVRYIGDLNEKKKKVVLLPGAWGGRNQITAAGRINPDVLIVGELSEWETAEYVRDARAMGNKLSLIILGHADSEEPGSKYMADWIRKNIAGMKVVEIPAGNPLQFG
ncbi:MAG: Nif3-like dinuclear metal center hexameric protein [Chitinophagaceae bacterium]|nr:Nif3-like dinuclear metal center hexameric protein [Chitinophagaceae bacterium]